jgi:hypothetical protein
MQIQFISALYFCLNKYHRKRERSIPQVVFKFPIRGPAGARICIPLKEPRNRFPAWRAGTSTLFVVPARHATQADGIDSSESIPGLFKRLQRRALNCGVSCTQRKQVPLSHIRRNTSSPHIAVDFHQLMNTQSRIMINDFFLCILYD